MADKLFTLETLAAKHGDCLLLHWGEPAQPRLMLIDGGPSGVYKKFLKQRLQALSASRGQPLVLDAVMISHIDDDHIRGILDLTGAMENAEDAERDSPYEIDNIWFNAFDDVLGNGQAVTAAANTTALLPPGLRHSGALIASVGQGRSLRDRAQRLGLKVNGGDDLIVGGWIWDFGEGLTLEVLAPQQTQIDEFRIAWDKEVERRGWAVRPDAVAIAAFVDKSPFNLASTVVLARLNNKTILLTGDARGDHILEGLTAHAYLASGFTSVDVLKVPHHGSDNNVSTDFFRQLRARHYVISGDGHHGNPEIATLEMIRAARGSAAYTVHLTYRQTRGDHHRELDDFLRRLPAADKKKFVFRADTSLSTRIELGTPLRD